MADDNAQRGCPPNIEMLASYFMLGRVGMFIGGHAGLSARFNDRTRTFCWTMLMSEIVAHTSYADDIMLVIELDSRTEVEKKADVTLRLVVKWGC